MRRLTNRPGPGRRIVLPDADRPAPEDAGADDAVKADDAAETVESSSLSREPHATSNGDRPDTRAVEDDDLAPAAASAGFRDPTPTGEPACGDPRDGTSHPAEPGPGPRYPVRPTAADHAADRDRLKRRMIAAGRERRGDRHDPEEVGVDPPLPGWYAPVIDEEEAESRPATASKPE